MSGSGGTRDDYLSRDAKSAGSDPCDKTWSGPISSPKQTALTGHQVDDILDVVIDKSSGRPVLAVEDSTGAIVGSLTFRGSVQIMECIETHGRDYQAVIVEISRGAWDVRVEPA